MLRLVIGELPLRVCQCLAQLQPLVQLPAAGLRLAGLKARLRQLNRQLLRHVRRQAAPAALLPEHQPLQPGQQRQRTLQGRAGIAALEQQRSVPLRFAVLPPPFLHQIRQGALAPLLLREQGEVAEAGAQLRRSQRTVETRIVVAVPAQLGRCGTHRLRAQPHPRGQAGGPFLREALGQPGIGLHDQQAADALLQGACQGRILHADNHGPGWISVVAPLSDQGIESGGRSADAAGGSRGGTVENAHRRRGHARGGAGVRAGSRG